MSPKKYLYVPRTCAKSPVKLALVVLGSVLSLNSNAQQMAPSGFSGAINTPSAFVLPLGSATLGYANTIPERATKFPSEPYGGITVGFGVLPGLEVVGRLAFDGDLNCNFFFDPNCQNRTRDLSVSAKYQLPIYLPLNSKVAIGFTDFGGAATSFRSVYGVATSSLGPVDVSLGYGKKVSNAALLDGVFGSVALRLTDKISLIAEKDGQANRLGVNFTQPVTEQLEFQVGLSKKFSGPANQTSQQLTASLRYLFEKRTPRDNRAAREATVSSRALASAQRQKLNDALSLQAKASAMTEALQKSGFAQVTIQHAPAAIGQAEAWRVVAEPLLRRRDLADALGAALPIWLDHIGSVPAALTLELTYMGRTYHQTSTTRQCLIGFMTGLDQCDQGNALIFGSDEASKPFPAYQTLNSQDGQLNFKPQFELGLDLVTSIGTDVGLIDHSLALDVGAQMQFARGLFVQGNVLAPVTQSDDFRAGGTFREIGHPETRVAQAAISYLLPLSLAEQKVQTQLTLGAINPARRGGQLDALWISNNGDWRVGGTLGAYQSSGNAKATTPALLSVRRSIFPGKWMLEGTAGKFLRGDVGWVVKSQHWFDNVRLGLVLSSSSGKTAQFPKRSFAGMEISMPFGGDWRKDLGWASVRAADRFEWGIRTKVGEKDNSITSGFAEIPRFRHGVWTDGTNHDRAGSSDLWVNRERIRQ